MSDCVVKIIESKDIEKGFYSNETNLDPLPIVHEILSAVRSSGDAAIHLYAQRFERANPTTLEIPLNELQKAEEKLSKADPELYASLCRSRDLVYSFAQHQRACFTDFETELSPGLVTGQKTISVERAGVYVPAGRFPLCSSVIMGIMPARAAGVDEIILCSPPSVHPDGSSSPYADETIMAVASMCGVSRMFAIGGAQAIAAMAYGTESVQRVQVIVGPGNKYVAAAKKAVFGQVGIDLVAGPTEVMIIADSSANPAWVAADLLAQAEHDIDAQSVLLTWDRSLAKKVQDEIETLVSALPADAAARKSFSSNGAIIIVENYAQAIEIANKKAPEHLELALEAGDSRDTIEKSVRNYGSLFIGHSAAEVLGDYAAGLNHTLPTAGSAAFTGGLSVRHFLKTVTTLRAADERSEGVQASLRAAQAIATREGLSGHALAAKCRLEKA